MWKAVFKPTPIYGIFPIDIHWKFRETEGEIYLLSWRFPRVGIEIDSVTKSSKPETFVI